MKSIFIIVFAFLISAPLFSQKTEFSVNKEKATYEFHKFGTKILKTTFHTQSGFTVDQDLKDLILQLMEEKKGFVSVDFVDATTLIVEYQETITDEIVFKNINRRGVVFVKVIEEFINFDKK